MRSPETNPVEHPDSRVRGLIAMCPSMASRLDLSEGVYYIMNQVAQDSRTDPLALTRWRSLPGACDTA
jgi:hypothetical protein